jgi:hypothetical protein
MGLAFLFNSVQKEEASAMEAEEIKTISRKDYLLQIVEAGWAIIGPRRDPKRDLRAAANFFKRGIAFVPEHVLLADGFQIVLPGPFTRGHQLMFKDDGQLRRYTRSQYALASGDIEIPLYVLLREDETKL